MLTPAVIINSIIKFARLKEAVGASIYYFNKKGGEKGGGKV